MAVLSSAQLLSGVLPDLAGPATSSAPDGLDAARRASFEGAMGRSGVAPAVPMQVAQAGVVLPQSTAQGVDVKGVDARERARRALDLEGPVRGEGQPRTTGGDAILGGLERLRGTFDGRHARIGAALEGKAVDMNALLAVQMEVAQYTLLIDVSSKLTGKATQSLDTLMKGQ